MPARLVLAELDRALEVVIRRAEEHRGSVCIGRTHGIHAEPTTFGWKLAGWAFELDRDRARLVRALESNRVGQLSGTVGSYGALDPEVERIACERLGLEPDPLSTQVIARDRHAELLSTLALVATSLDRFATEIRHLARTEVREVEEPFAHGMKGSSAMPHKRNPKVAERICGLARVVRAASVVGLENVVLWHERDISQSSAERIVVPDAFLALDYMLDRFIWIVDGLVVYPERMLRNLAASHGLVFSHGLLLALVDAGPAAQRGLPARTAERDEVAGTRSSTSVRSSAADPEISARLDSAALDRVFDLAAAVRHAEVVFERLRTLTRKEDPSMSEALSHVASGKVRELYALDEERLLLVASDRISTFDVVLPTEIPDKGRVLTGLSGFWFAQTAGIVPNHLLALGDDGRSTECRRLEMLPIECVVRGYLAGSGWKDYRATGEVCGHELPAGLSESDRLPEPIFTPATKAQSGHDENIDRSAAVALVGEERFDEAERLTLELYRFVSERALERGIILADTKLEFGVDPRGPARARRRGVHPGFLSVLARRRVRARRRRSRRSTSSSSATTARRSAGARRYPGPELPADVVEGTRGRYVEAFELLTGIEFADYVAEPALVLG